MGRSRFDELELRLFEVARKQEIVVEKLLTLTENLALDSVTRLRKELSRTLRDLRLANKDRKMLRKEVIKLHNLLNDQVEDMKPRLSGNQYGRKLI